VKPLKFNLGSQLQHFILQLITFLPIKISNFKFFKILFFKSQHAIACNLEELKIALFLAFVIFQFTVESQDWIQKDFFATLQ